MHCDAQYTVHFLDMEIGVLCGPEPHLGLSFGTMLGCPLWLLFWRCLEPHSSLVFEWDALHKLPSAVEEALTPGIHNKTGFFFFLFVFLWFEVLFTAVGHFERRAEDHCLWERLLLPVSIT